MGDAIGAHIEFAIGQAFVAADQRNRVWRRCRLSLEQIMNQGCPIIVERGRIAAIKQSLSFDVGHDREARCANIAVC